MKIIICLIFTTFCFKSFSQSTVGVPEDFQTIQEALDEANELDTILVSPGTYYENLKWPEKKDMLLIGEKGPDSTIIDGSDVGQVLQMKLLTESSLLEGFTIQNGTMYQFSNSRWGAGLRADSCALKLKNLNITNNRIIDEFQAGGAGAYLFKHNGDIESCIFQNNFIETTDFTRGVGLVIEPDSDIELIDCKFNNNNGLSEGRSNGAGLYIKTNTAAFIATPIKPLVVLNNCEFSKNTLEGSNADGAGLYVFGALELKMTYCHFLENECLNKGGAIYLRDDVSMDLGKSIINSNKAETGSAVYYHGNRINSASIVISNTIFRENEINLSSTRKSTLDFNFDVDIIFANSIISHNQGHPILTDLLFDRNEVSIINSTIAYNELPIFIEGTNLSISESILWDNGESEIEENNPLDNSIQVSNSLVKGGFEGINVIDSDPLFISEDLLIPSEDSPCINAGDPSLNVATDLLGNPRPMPVGTNPDLGAYEVDQSINSNTTNQSGKRFKTFPNPVRDMIMFSDRVELVKVYSTVGELMKIRRNTDSINVEELQPGSYVIKIITGQIEQLETVVIVR